MIDIVNSGKLDINNNAKQAAAYRVLVDDPRNNRRTPASDKATKVPCQVKWINVHPKTSIIDRQVSSVFIACLPPAHPAGDGSAPVHQPRPALPPTPALPVATPSRRKPYQADRSPVVVESPPA